jgi:glycosyltransferase involved in cell wall biosynthesis
VFLSRFVPGGTEKQIIELVSRLDQDRFALHIACFDRTGPWLAKVEDCVESLAEFPVAGFTRAATLRQMRRFARWCRENRIAVVHTTDLYTNIIGLPAARLAEVPVRIGSRREINPDKGPALIALQRAAYACATRVVANCRAAADRLRREAVAAPTIAVIPNGLEIEAFAPRQLATRLRRIITVANLRKEKAHEVLLEAAVPILDRYPDAEFSIVGGGARYADLATLARRLGVQQRVRFLGHREDIPSLLGGSDIFVLPSRSESFPNGLIEAMASGLPVVATSVGGNTELVQHGENGLLVPPDDAHAIASSIHDLIESPERAAALGRAARASVVSRFSFERMVAAFETLYLTEFESAGSRIQVRARREEAERDESPPRSDRAWRGAADPATLTMRGAGDPPL